MDTIFEGSHSLMMLVKAMVVIVKDVAAFGIAMRMCVI